MQQLTVFDLMRAAAPPPPPPPPPGPQLTGDEFCVGMWIAWTGLTEFEIIEIKDEKYGRFAKVKGVSWDVCLNNPHYPVWPAYGPHPVPRPMQWGECWSPHQKDRVPDQGRFRHVGRVV